MAYTWIALDLDGTLTNSQKRISEGTRAALLRAQEKGVRLALVSGRPTHGVEPLAEALSMGEFGGYLISYNGGRIVDYKTREVLYRRSIPEASLPALCALPHRYPALTAIVYHGAMLLTEDPENPYVRFDGGVNHMHIVGVEDLYKALDFCPAKFLFPGDAGFIARFLPQLQRDMPNLSIYCSEPYYLEVMPPHVDKGDALSALAQKAGLLQEELLAFGDGFNDVSMLRYAGCGVAMGNAQPPTKAAADFVTKTNDEDGIVYALQYFEVL